MLTKLVSMLTKRVLTRECRTLVIFKSVAVAEVGDKILLRSPAAGYFVPVAEVGDKILSRSPTSVSIGAVRGMLDNMFDVPNSEDRTN